MENMQIRTSIKLLVFQLDRMEFGIDADKVVTIIERDAAITRVPKAPFYVNGVMNLNGEMLPVVDLRKWVGLKENTQSLHTKMIVVEDEEISVGLIVDAVCEVILITAENIKQAESAYPDFSAIDVDGIVIKDGREVMLLNVERFLISI